MAKGRPNKKKKPRPGKQHENKVHAAIKRLYPGRKIEADVRRPGVISGGERQIDTLLYHEEGLIDFEAKDYKRNIGIDTVAKYAFKVQDEQIPRGVMVSNSPYAPTAVSTANHFGIQLAHVIDTADKQSKFKILQKTLVRDKVVWALSMGVRHRGFEAISVQEDLGRMQLEDDNGVRLPAYNVFQKLWNDDALPREDGQHVHTLTRQKMVMTDGRVIAVDEFYFDYIVKTVYRQGQWQLEQARGLYDVGKGSFTTNGDMTSTILSTDEINSWEEITQAEADSNTYGMVCEMVSMLPDEPPTRAQ